MGLSYEDYKAWLSSQPVDQQTRDGLLEQRALFDANRDQIKRDFWFYWVGFVGGELQASGTAHDLFEKAHMRFPGRQLYFEPVGFTATRPFLYEIS